MDCIRHILSCSPNEIPEGFQKEKFVKCRKVAREKYFLGSSFLSLSFSRERERVGIIHFGLSGERN